MQRQTDASWKCIGCTVDEDEGMMLERPEKRDRMVRALVTASEYMGIMEQVGEGSLSSWMREAAIEKLTRDRGF